MQRRIFYLLTIAVLFFGANLFMVHIASQTKPFSLRNMLNAVASIKGTPGSQNKKILAGRIIKNIRERKIDFPLTKENEKLLRDEGATDEIIDAIRQNSPPLPTPTPLPDEFKNSITMEFVKIPKGSFMMGSEKEDDEKPVHKVTINYEFYLGKYEVTIGEWKKLMGDLPEGMKTGLRDEFKESDRQPVVQLFWGDIKGFIKKLNEKNDGYEYRLPSEAEWEYAARAGTTTEFAFGNTLGSDQANFAGAYSAADRQQGESFGKTIGVGRYKPNAWGLYDMHGNAWEWVEDIYSSNYDYPTLPTDGSANLSVGNSNLRVVRGGSWHYYAIACRSASRYSGDPTVLNDHDYAVGFRVVARLK